MMKNSPRYRVLHIPAERYPTHQSFLSEVLARKTEEYGPVFLMADAGSDKSQHGWSEVEVYTFPILPKVKALKWINTYCSTDLRHFYFMVKIFFKHKINIIQVRDLTFPLLFGLFLKLFFKTKVIYQKSHPLEDPKIRNARNNVHGQVFPKLFYYSKLIENKLLHRAMRHCDAVLPITGAMADNLHKDYGLNHSIMEPFGLGFEYSKSRQRESCRPDLSSEVRLIYVGAIGTSRRIDLFLQGIKAFTDIYPDINIRVEIVGGALPDIERLRQHGISIGVGDICSFTGQIAREEVYKKIQSSHIGISWIGSNKRFEDASPTKAIEYLCLGIPVIATDTVLEHQKLSNETGALIVTKLDQQSFCENLYRLYKCYDDFSCRAAKAKEYMHRDYSYENMRKKLHSLYDKVLS